MAQAQGRHLWQGRAVNSFTQIEREYAAFVTIVGRVARGPWGSIDVMAGPGVGTLVRLTGTNRPTGFVRAYSLGLFVRGWW